MKDFSKEIRSSMDTTLSILIEEIERLRKQQATLSREISDLKQQISTLSNSNHNGMEKKHSAEVVQPILEEISIDTKEPAIDFEEISTNSEIKLTPLNPIIDKPVSEQEKEITRFDNDFNITFGDDGFDTVKPLWWTDFPGFSIDSICKAISINDKSLFIRELFDDDDDQYELSISSIEELPSFEEVVYYLRRAFDWDESSDTVYRFYMIVRRKFI